MNATRARWVLAALLALAVVACSEKGRPPLEAGRDAAPRFTPPGKCFGKPSKCISDAQCGPPFSTCQEGACCSGIIDPETCVCTCAGGPACPAGQACCTGDGRGSAARGALKCRDLEECFGPR
jgi:hypothetical protein